MRLADLPYGRCKYCPCAEVKWQDFVEEIYDVIPVVSGDSGPAVGCDLTNVESNVKDLFGQ